MISNLEGKDEEEVSGIEYLLHPLRDLPHQPPWQTFLLSGRVRVHVPQHQLEDLGAQAPCKRQCQISQFAPLAWANRCGNIGPSMTP